MDVESQEIPVKITWTQKFSYFWFDKNPVCFLWMWLIMMLTIAITVSELSKNK